MDLVVSAILKLRENLGRGTFADVVIAREDAGDAIGKKLYAMNHEALWQRYGTLENCPPYRWQPAGYKTPVRSYKAVQCLLYQCSEGDVPETPLYAELESIKNHLATRIIGELPAYNAVPWDVDRRDARFVAAETVGG
jgi:hypothetical protein